MTDPNQISSPTGDASTQFEIGGYNSVSNLDLMFALDYKSESKLDHIVAYRPGSGIIWILENKNPPAQQAIYQPVYHEGDPASGTNGNGIGTFDLADTADRIFAFDLEGSGKLDDLILYRPGGGIIFILQNDAGNFSVVYSSPVVNGVAQGICNYDLASPADHVFAFDLEGSGNMDDLVLYRPGTGIISILQNSDTHPGTFSVAFTNGSEPGIGGYDLMSTADRAFAFDYEGNGKADDIALYRPGGGAFWIVQNQHTNPATFKLPYPQPPADGIGGYELASPADQVFAFDYESNGNLDDLVLFRPGQGTIFVLQNNHAVAPNPPSFAQAFKEIGNPPYSVGIAGFDFLATVDQGFAFDFSGVGHQDHLLFFRPGTGAVTIFENNRTTPGSFNPAPYQTGLSSLEQIARNLNNIQTLNTALNSYASNETFNAYLLLTDNGNNSTSWGLTVGLQLLGGVFWAAAGAIGSISGVWAIVAAGAGFLASFAPGMLSAWISAGVTPTGTDVNGSVAGLVQGFQTSETNLNDQLGDYANDVEGYWNQSYKFNGQTASVKDLAGMTIPTGGPGYDLLFQVMSGAFLQEIWKTILCADYKITQFPGCNCPDPGSSFYPPYYEKNPSYCLVYGQGVMSFFNVGTGAGDMPWDGDGGLNVPACGYLFSTFDRNAVFFTWGIPQTQSDRNPQGPYPPDCGL